MHIRYTITGCVTHSEELEGLHCSESLLGCLYAPICCSASLIDISKTSFMFECHLAACSLTSKQSSQEQGADKQCQQWILVLAVGALAVQVLQVRVKAVLEVRVPAARREVKLRMGVGPADVFMCFHAHQKAPQVTQHIRDV
jgi:hypothetical protein